MADLDFESYLILALVLLVPAIIVFIILNVMRVRRGKFHRQKVTKKSGKA